MKLSIIPVLINGKSVLLWSSPSNIANLKLGGQVDFGGNVPDRVTRVYFFFWNKIRFI